MDKSTRKEKRPGIYREKRSMKTKYEYGETKKECI
jgi:hypothetical protein